MGSATGRYWAGGRLAASRRRLPEADTDLDVACNLLADARLQISGLRQPRRTAVARPGNGQSRLREPAAAVARPSMIVLLDR